MQEWKRILGSLGALMLSWHFVTRAAPAEEADWAQWRGPNRDGVSHETGLLASWPQDGPNELWRVAVGEGYSGLSIANGRMYTMSSEGADEFVLCLDAANGSELWRFRADSNFINDQGSGPRSTPTVDGEVLFALSSKGELYALKTADGNKLWKRDLRKNFGSRIPDFGFSTSPLVEGDLLFVEAGGGPGQALVALDKENGEVVWTAHTDMASYSSPIAVTYAGVRQIVFLTQNSLVSLAPRDGRIHWQYVWTESANIATPILVPPDKLFISSGYGKGAALLQMKETDTGVAVEEVWQTKAMKNQFNSSVLHDGHLYGFDNAILKCIRADNGTEQWKARSVGQGSLIYADGHLLVLGEGGELGLIEATPAGYSEKARVQVLNGKCWTPPTLTGGRLYLRDDKEIICLDLAKRGI